MPSGIKIYKVNDFIRKTEAGELDFDKSVQFIREIAAAATVHTDHNILVDLRRTTLQSAAMSEVIKLANEVARYMPSFNNKIANLVPDIADRVAIAKRFEACMQIKNYDYRFFTQFEDAIEWLSDVAE
jgi:hypothetical protein